MASSRLAGRPRRRNPPRPGRRAAKRAQWPGMGGWAPGTPDGAAVMNAARPGGCRDGWRTVTVAGPAAGCEPFRQGSELPVRLSPSRCSWSRCLSALGLFSSVRPRSAEDPARCRAEPASFSLFTNQRRQCFPEHPEPLKAGAGLIEDLAFKAGCRGAMVSPLHCQLHRQHRRGQGLGISTKGSTGAGGRAASHR